MASASVLCSWREGGKRFGGEAAQRAFLSILSEGLEQGDRFVVRHDLCQHIRLLERVFSGGLKLLELRLVLPDQPVGRRDPILLRGSLHLFTSGVVVIDHVLGELLHLIAYRL